MESNNAYARRTDAERMLLRALLLDAIRCLAGDGRPEAQRVRLAEEARVWVTSRDIRWPYSFENVCAWLNMPADRLRVSLLKLAAEATSAEDGANHPLKARRMSRIEARARADRNKRICALRAAGWSPRDIAEEFGLGYDMILLICARDVAAIATDDPTEEKSCATG